MDAGPPMANATMDANDAARRRRTGGALLAAGAGAWIGHGALMLVGLMGIFGLASALTTPAAALQAANTSLAAYAAATAAATVGSFLYAFGLFSFQRGANGLVWREPATGNPYAVSVGTRRKALLASGLIGTYGVFGAVALTATALLWSNPLDPSAITYFTLIFGSWMVGSFALVAGGVFYMSFLRKLRNETLNTSTPGGWGLLVFGILNLIGTVLLAYPIFAVMGGSLDFSLVIPLAIGALLSLLANPIIAIIVFSLGVASGLRLRKLEAGPIAVPVAAPAPYAYPQPNAYYNPYTQYAPPPPQWTPPPPPPQPYQEQVPPPPVN